MTDHGETRLFSVKGGRHFIYIRSDMVRDSAFPFAPNQKVVVSIEGDRLIVEAAESP